MTHEPTFERLLVVLDPSSRDGDSGAKLARSLVGLNGHIELAVGLAGPEARALGEFAAAESMTIKDAAEVYLRQTIERIGSDGVTSTMFDGTDLAADVIGAVVTSNSAAAVLPAAMADRARSNRVAWDAIDFPVVVVPTYRVAA